MASYNTKAAILLFIFWSDRRLCFNYTALIVTHFLINCVSFLFFIVSRTFAQLTHLCQLAKTACFVMHMICKCRRQLFFKNKKGTRKNQILKSLLIYGTKSRSIFDEIWAARSSKKVTNVIQTDWQTKWESSNENYRFA